MLNRVVLLIVLLGLLAVSSCGSELQDQQKEESKSYTIDWIEGIWNDSTTFGYRKQSYVEEWIKTSDNTFQGKKYSINAGDTNEVTPLTIVNTEGKYYYTFELDGEQKTYIQDSINESYLRFSNTLDEFPQVITYLNGNDSLYITISGIANGIDRAFTFKTTKLH